MVAKAVGSAASRNAASARPAQGKTIHRIAVVWTQFTAYHVDRCIAIAERLGERAELIAVEVAATSLDYAGFAKSGATGRARKVTLFPGRSFDAIAPWRRACAVLRAVARCPTVCIGIPYSRLEFLALAWLMRLLGKRVVLISVSKRDDVPRKASFEFAKRLGLSCYSALIVPGPRAKAYYDSLGFRRRPVLIGGNTISIERIRSEAVLALTKPPHFGRRDFVFVGRFIAKKNLHLLIEGFALYCACEPASRRRLVLIGSGPQEAGLRDKVKALGLDERVVFAGFLEGAALAGQLSQALGLILVSHNEQWGLVINEAAALGIPAIVSESPGGRDILVRNLISGYVVEQDSAGSIAQAMRALGADEAAWLEMRSCTLARAPLGDVSILADAIEHLLFAPSGSGQVLDGAYQAAMSEFGAPPPPTRHVANR